MAVPGLTWTGRKYHSKGGGKHPSPSRAAEVVLAESLLVSGMQLHVVTYQPQVRGYKGGWLGGWMPSKQ